MACHFSFSEDSCPYLIMDWLHSSAMLSAQGSHSAAEFGRTSELHRRVLEPGNRNNPPIWVASRRKALIGYFCLSDIHSEQKEHSTMVLRWSFLSKHTLSQSSWKIWAKLKSLVNVNLWFLYSKEVFKFRRRLFKQCCTDQTHGNSRL